MIIPSEIIDFSMILVGITSIHLSFIEMPSNLKEHEKLMFAPFAMVGSISMAILGMVAVNVFPESSFVIIGFSLSYFGKLIFRYITNKTEDE